MKKKKVAYLQYNKLLTDGEKEKLHKWLRERDVAHIDRIKKGKKHGRPDFTFRCRGQSSDFNG